MYGNWRLRPFSTVPTTTKSRIGPHAGNFVQLPTPLPIQHVPPRHVPTGSHIIKRPDLTILSQLPVDISIKPRPPVPPFRKAFASADEERHVISILHLVGLYDSETKMMTKVTHLQQLSQVSFSITEFKQDRRFLALLKTIHRDVVPNAGPSHLQIISASYARLNLKTLKLWTAVLKRTQKCARRNLLVGLPHRVLSITGPNICLIVSKIAEMEVRPYGLISRLFTHIGKVSSELHPVDIERALCAMRRLHMTPVESDDITQRSHLDTIRALCQKTKQSLQYTPSVILVRIMRHLSALGYVPVNLIPMAEKRLLVNINRLPPESLSSIALSYKKMKLWHPHVLEPLATAVEDRLSEMPPDVLSTSFSALVDQGIRRPSFLESACRHIAEW